MPIDADAVALRESRVDEVVAEYCRAVDAGYPPDRDRFLARYPDLADDLTAFLDGVVVIGQCVPFGTGLAPRQRTCPYCRTALSGAASGTFCAGCGSRFRLDCGRTTALPAGGRIGRFVLIAVAGRGAFGTVFRAWDPEHDRPVAVKVPRTDTLTVRADIERFFREATCAAPLSHPGIVAVYEAGEADGVQYIASEFVPGQTLAAVLREGRLHPDRAAELAGTIAATLTYAHENGVVHRDVKPSNILIGGDNVPRLTDFGLALFSGGDPTLTRNGEILGAPAYMSPEQASGRSHEADARSDIYSLGVVLYEMLTGSRPFVGIVPVVLHRIQNEDPCAPRSLNPQIPRDLETVCLKCLRKEPAARYATAAELAEDLRLFRAGLPVRARPLGSFERLARWARRNRALAAAYLAAATLLVSSTAIAIAWAVHASRQADALQVALNQSKETRAKADLDRGLTEADRGDVGAGLLWMARSVEVAPDPTGEVAWAARANLNAWSHHFPRLTNCAGPPPGKVLGFGPDGHSAWYLDADGKTVRRWDVVAGRTIEPTLRHLGPVMALAISPDGRRVAVGCSTPTGGVYLWDIATGTAEPAPEIPQSVRGAAFSPDGRSIYLAATESQQQAQATGTVVQAWDGLSLQTVGRIPHQPGGVAMAVRPQSRTLFTATLADKKLRGWDVSEGRQVDVLLGHPVPVKAVAISPDGRHALTSGDDRVARLWEIESGRLLAVLHHQTTVTAVAFGQDGKTLLTAGQGDSIRIWAWRGAETGRSGPFEGRVWAVAVGPDGKSVATGVGREVRIWRVGPAGLELRSVLPAQAYPTRALAFSPDGKLLAASGPAQKGAWLWDVETGKAVAHLGHDAWVLKIAFSPDGRRVATAGDAHDARVWNVPAFAGEASTLAFGPLVHGGTARAVAFSPDGRFVVTAGNDGRARRWDARTGAALEPSLPHGDNVHVIAFHPSALREFLTAGDDGVVRRWDVETGAAIGPALCHGDPIWVAAYGSDGRTILSGGSDGIIRIWDHTTGQGVGPPLRQSHRIRAVAADPTGRWAVTASEDGSARLWAIRLGRRIGPVVWHEPEAHCAVVSPKGDWVLTGGWDRTIRFQPAPSDSGASPERLVLRTQVGTGMELDASGDVRVLGPAAWRRCRDALQEYGPSFP